MLPQLFILTNCHNGLIDHLLPMGNHRFPRVAALIPAKLRAKRKVSKRMGTKPPRTSAGALGQKCGDQKLKMPRRC